jgi:hypothetical protein
MKLTFIDKTAAQTRATEIHNALIASNPDYADSVAKGHTLRWAIPFQDLDINRVPIGTTWYAGVDNRCWGNLTLAEKTAAAV